MANNASGVSSKKAGIEEVFSRNEIDELKRCHSDPIYFIENYFRIQHTVEGDILFKPYDYQKDMVKSFHDNRFSIAMLGRQQGKCLYSSTYISIKSSTCQQIKIKIGDFYNWLKFKNDTQYIIDNCLSNL